MNKQNDLEPLVDWWINLSNDIDNLKREISKENTMKKEKINMFISKPPLGVSPKKMHEEMRVRDLCRALYEYGFEDDMPYSVMLTWAEELAERLSNLKFDQEI